MITVSPFKGYSLFTMKNFLMFFLPKLNVFDSPDVEEDMEEGK